MEKSLQMKKVIYKACFKYLHACAHMQANLTLCCLNAEKARPSFCLSQLSLYLIFVTTEMVLVLAEGSEDRGFPTVKAQGVHGLVLPIDKEWNILSDP